MALPSPDFDIKWGMVIDIDKCTGCGACMASCQIENNIAPELDASNKLRAITWLRIFELSNGKAFPEHEIAYLPVPCQQCGHPPCVPVCPVTATDKKENGGIVSQVPPRCIGCRYCMAACPYHSRYFNWHDPVWPEGMEKTLTPHASVRSRGVVEKCNFCHHRWDYARDKFRENGMNPADLPEDAYVPACVEICPTGALAFGDLKNPRHLVHKLSKSKHSFRLLERLTTDPQIYYLSRRSWVHRQGDNYLTKV